MSFFTKHRHLIPEVLSKFLDDRLSVPKRQKVATQFESCAECGGEVESLWSAIALIRWVPDLPPNRSFTFSAPPPVLMPYPRGSGFRMPNWEYEGAASIAGLALAIPVSADATGLLPPKGLVISQESTTAGAAEPLEQDKAITPAPMAEGLSPTDIPLEQAASAVAPFAAEAPTRFGGHQARRRQNSPAEHLRRTPRLQRPHRFEQPE